MDVLENGNGNDAVIITFFLINEEEVGNSYIFYGDNSYEMALECLQNNSKGTKGYKWEFITLEEIKPGMLKISGRTDLES